MPMRATDPNRSHGFRRALLACAAAAVALLGVVGFDAMPAHAQDEPAGEAAAAGELQVSDLAFALSLTEREPSERLSSFSIGDKIYGWVELANDGGETEIEMVWKHEGKESWRTSLSVGRGKTWRTWSKKKIRSGQTGSWTVEILAAGKVIHTANFTVAE